MKKVKKTVLSALAFIFVFSAFYVGCLAACEHVRIYFEPVAPTCSQEGRNEGYYCTKCNSWLSGGETLAPKHTNVKTYAGKKQTCTTDGYTAGIYCSDCKKWVSGHRKISACHTNTKTVQGKSQSCTTEGYTEGLYCQDCKTWLYGHEIIPPSHNTRYVEEIPPTCTGNGYTAGRYCVDCRKYTEGHEEIPFIDHSFTQKVIDDEHLVSKATASSPAVYRFECELCSLQGSKTFTYGEPLTLGRTSKIASKQSDSAIKLAWKYVEGADGYEIYYKKAGKWVLCADTNNVSHIFKGLKGGTAFVFAVRAYAQTGAYRNRAKTYTTYKTATLPSAPAKIVSASNTSAIHLAWAKCQGATGYRIFYRKGDKWVVKVGSTAKTEHIFKNLPAGKSYVLAVRPYTTVDGKVVWGSYKTYKAATSPEAPESAVNSPVKGTVTLAWRTVSGAEGYQLLYKFAGEKVQLYGVYPKAQKLRFDNLKSGQRIFFAVRAYIKTSSGYIYSDYETLNVTVK